MNYRHRIHERWEKGIPHDPRSEEIAHGIAEIDIECDNSFDFRFGGDGDNGEELLFLLDCYFEDKDKRVMATLNSIVQSTGSTVSEEPKDLTDEEVCVLFPGDEEE